MRWRLHPTLARCCWTSGHRAHPVRTARLTQPHSPNLLSASEPSRRRRQHPATKATIIVHDLALLRLSTSHNQPPHHALFFFFNKPAPPELAPLPLRAALPT